MSRVYNFSAGPSTLPESVLQKAGAEIMDYHGSGQSVMEMSHRSKWFDDIIKEAEKLMRELYKVPDNYKVLFLQGGASAQFSAIPLNFMNGSGKADYIITGQWAKKAFQEAQKYGDVVAAASSADKTFTYIPKTKPEDFRDDADYVYEDELEEERIGENFGRLFEELLEQLWKHGKTTLPELMAIYEIKFGKEIYRNGDVYSFLVHLAQKNRYEFKHMQDKQDTFLEGIVMNRLSVEKKDKYGNMVFEIFFEVGNILNFGEKKDEAFSITDMRFETV